MHEVENEVAAQRNLKLTRLGVSTSTLSRTFEGETPWMHVILRLLIVLLWSIERGVASADGVTWLHVRGGGHTWETDPYPSFNIADVSVVARAYFHP